MRQLTIVSAIPMPVISSTDPTLPESNRVMHAFRKRVCITRLARRAYGVLVHHIRPPHLRAAYELPTRLGWPGFTSTPRHMVGASPERRLDAALSLAAAAASVQPGRVPAAPYSEFERVYL